MQNLSNLNRRFNRPSSKTNGLLPAQNRLIRVAVIDDEPVLLESLGHYLSSCVEFAPTQVYASAAAAIVDLTAKPVDIALVDIRLAGESGIDCIARLRAQGGANFLLAHTVAGDSETLAAAFAAGAHGYVIKSSKLSEVRDALLGLQMGRPAVSPGAVRHILESFRIKTSEAPPSSGLTPMEWRILSESAAGFKCKAIALRLNLALGTVYVHNRNIFRKLKVNTQLQAIARYHEILRKTPSQTAPCGSGEAV